MSESAPSSLPVGLVLAGGRARRMGGGLKALVPFRGWPMLAWSLEALRPHCSRLFVSANHAEPFAPFGLPVVADSVADRGPLGGIHAGLVVAAGAPLLVLACDLPLLRAEHLAPLVEVGPGVDVAVYGHERGLEPLAAWYGPGVRPALESMLEQGVCKVSELFERVDTAILPWPGSLDVFANANRPEDLERLEALAVDG